MLIINGVQQDFDLLDTEMEKFSAKLDFGVIEEQTLKKAEGIAYTDLGNINTYSENPENAKYSTTTTVTSADTKEIDGIKLTKITSSNFYHVFECRNLLDSGKVYRISGFIQTEETPFFFFVSSDTSGINKAFYCDSKLRRFSHIITGTTSATFYVQGKSNFKGKTALDYTNNFYLGGLQVEEIESGVENGFAVIGDSTVQYNAGTADSYDNTAWVKFMGALLSCKFYNKGVAGEKTQDMINRWATDMTPLASVVNTAIIQGGINDLGNGGTFDSVSTNLQTMYDLAIADGYDRVIMCTVTPFGQTGIKEDYRQQVNSWIRNKFEYVLDLDEVVRDPDDNSLLNQDSAWVGDGTHYDLTARIAVANNGYQNRNTLFDNFSPWGEYIKVTD